MTPSTTDVTDAIAPPGLSAAVEPLADELADRWRAGDHIAVEALLADRPDLRFQPRAVLDLLAEELALRAECRVPTTASALAARFPDLAAEVRRLFACQHALAPLAPPRFPAAGERLGPFRLVRELGRGANGRVFLATQPDLADRPVVLKLSPGGGEHLALAKLQHTHIVPLLSAHDFPTLGLRGLCLPYFGGATLADRPPHGLTADAACRIVLALADALAHAHARGLLHLDLKPGNVLLADDGTPLLLDFHLALPPLEPGSAAPPWFGGTAGYMPPEQEEALAAIRAGRRVPRRIDGRADLFALGLVTGELLKAAGSRSSALAAVVERCTHADPANRYPTVAALADDLRRHSADLPLRGVPNRSVVERWAKWRRRAPLALPLLLGLTAVLGFATAATLRERAAVEREAAALAQAEQHLAAGQWTAAAAALRGAAPARPDPRWRAALARAEAGVTAERWHAVAERLRPLYAADLPAAALADAAVLARSAWAARPAAVTDTTQADTLDVGIVAAHLTTRATGDRLAAVALLDEAEALAGPSAALDLERGRPRGREPRSAWEWAAVARADYAAGRLDAAAQACERCLSLDPRAVWGHHTAGCVALKRGDGPRALAAFAAAAALAPDSGWCRHNRGLAYAALGRHGEADADFAAAVALDPTVAGGRSDGDRPPR